jgi:adenylate kinase
MNIFVAGVHGVGKTFLASRLPTAHGLMHTSASKLIREEQMMPNWGDDKRVGDVDANQIALAAAVKRHNGRGTRLLLDGHFVLLDAEGKFSRIGTDVFRSLNLDAVVLLEVPPATISQRIHERDGRVVSVEDLTDFIAAERAQAQLVCEQIGIPLNVLTSPSPEIFAQTVAAFAAGSGE